MNNLYKSKNTFIRTIMICLLFLANIILVSCSQNQDKSIENSTSLLECFLHSYSSYYELTSNDTLHIRQDKNWSDGFSYITVISSREYIQTGSYFEFQTSHKGLAIFFSFGKFDRGKYIPETIFSDTNSIISKDFKLNRVKRRPMLEEEILFASTSNEYQFLYSQKEKCIKFLENSGNTELKYKLEQECSICGQ
jgi:hypothetical protein